MSGIELVNITGPLIEQWNKEHDRKAALWCENKECNSKVSDLMESFRHSNTWVLHMVLEGSALAQQHIQEVTQLLQQGINPKMSVQFSTPSM